MSNFAHPTNRLIVLRNSLARRNNNNNNNKSTYLGTYIYIRSASGLQLNSHRPCRGKFRCMNKYLFTVNDAQSQRRWSCERSRNFHRNRIARATTTRTSRKSREIFNTIRYEVSVSRSKVVSIRPSPPGVINTMLRLTPGDGR